MTFYLKSKLPDGHQSATGCRGLIIERQFIPISQGECDERSSRLRALLLVGAKRLTAQGQNQKDNREGNELWAY